MGTVMRSPPQLGRGEDSTFMAGDASPSSLKGQVEFFLMTDEIEEGAVKHIARQSKQQAAYFQQELHSTNLQQKSKRAQMVPLQRGMRKETEAWNNLLLVITAKGEEEVKSA